MAHNVFIRGLSTAGFRIPKVGGGWGTVKRANGTATQVDLDDDITAKYLVGERDNFIRVAAGGTTTAVIVGLDRLGFRIVDNGGVTRYVKSGGSSVTVDLTDGKACRVLRRNPGRYSASTAQTAISVYGIRAPQLGFEIAQGSQATATLTQDGTTTLPVAGTTVTINDKTYRWESTLALANDVKIGVDIATSLGSLAKAVNLNGVAGTDYFAGTTAPTNVTAGSIVGTGAGTNLTFTTTIFGLAANAFVSTQTSAHLSFGAATFTGGGANSSVGNNGQIGITKVNASVLAAVSVDATQAWNRRTLRRFYKAWVEA